MADRIDELNEGVYIDIQDFGYESLTGIPLLQIFSVSFSKNVDNERRSEIFGKIRVTDERGTKARLYKCRAKHLKPVLPNEILTMKGPPRAISALTSFTIYLNLRVKDKDGNLEISNGKIFWDMSCARYHDKLLALNVPGKDGFATVHCAVFSVATETSLEIELVRKEQSDDNNDVPVDHVNFYGTIVAYYGRMFDYSSNDQKKFFRTTLFNRSSEDSLELEYGESIPLLSPVVTVPVYTSLVIEVDLFVSGSNVQFLQGATTELLPGKHDESSISGNGFLAKVIANWNGLYREEDFK